MVVRTKTEFLCCSIFEWGTKKGLEFKVACLSMMFFAVKSWNFFDLICLLFAGRGFKNCLAWAVLLADNPKLFQVGGVKPGCFKIGNTGGMLDNILSSKLYRPGR